MGHFRLKLTRAGSIPRDPNLKVRMQRLPEAADGESREEREFGGCVAAFEAWDVTDVITPGEPFDIVVWPSEDSVLCEGDCLDWVAEWSGCPGDPPDYVVTPDDDCVGIVVTIDDTEEALTDCVLTLTASLKGEPFGTPVVVAMPTSCTSECTGFIYPEGDTFPNVGIGENFTVTIQLDANDCACVDNVDNISWDFAVSTVDLAAGSVTYVGGCQWQQQFFNIGAESLEGEFLTMTPYLDEGEGPTPICGGSATFFCEA